MTDGTPPASEGAQPLDARAGSAGSGGSASRSGGPGPARGSAASILADRLAAVLVHHDPGWRLPRHTTLARRYQVSPAQIAEALQELIDRRLISQLPDGQLHRSSPAQCLIPVPGVARLAAHVDPMGSQLSCRHRKVSWRRVAEEIGWTLGMAPPQPVCAVRCQWDANCEPAAISTTYLSARVAGQVTDGSGLAESSQVLPLGGAADEAASRDGGPALGLARALQLEMQPPAASVARALRLSAGQPAVMVTVRFDDPVTGRPVALTTAALRADLFRIVIEAA